MFSAALDALPRCSGRLGCFMNLKAVHLNFNGYKINETVSFTYFGKRERGAGRYMFQ